MYFTLLVLKLDVLLGPYKSWNRISILVQFRYLGFFKLLKIKGPIPSSFLSGMDEEQCSRECYCGERPLSTCILRYRLQDADIRLYYDGMHWNICLQLKLRRVYVYRCLHIKGTYFYSSLLFRRIMPVFFQPAAIQQNNSTRVVVTELGTT